MASMGDVTPYRINNLGQAVGNTHGYPYYAFLWEAGGLQTLGTLGGDVSQALDINNSSQVVGWSLIQDGNSRAFLWEDGEMKDLNELIPQDSGWVLITATATNDLGEIVGQGAFEGQERVYLLKPNRIAVDGNRDGKVSFSEPSDATDKDHPYRFWLNHDHDVPEFLREFFLRVPEWESTEKDSDDRIVKTRRDLEDFAQLAIRVDASIKKKIDKGYQLAIETTADLEIQLYRAVKPGTGYLFNTDTASDQLNGTYQVNGVTRKRGEALELTKLHDFIDAGEYTDEPIAFLFEGKKGGEGIIRLVLKKPEPDGSAEQSHEVHVKLMDIKEMYQRVRATPEDGFQAPYESGYTQPSVGFNPVGTPAFQKPPDEQKECIVFVHGWNLTLWEVENWSDTMFKRLWWQGYEGRFASFRWPPMSAGATGKDFNRSEHRAFKYGTAFLAYVNSLKGELGGYGMHVAAHSQGGMLVSEALQQGLMVDNVVLMQAAVPASCYDRDMALDIQNLLDAEKKQQTPDLDLDGGYRGYFHDITVPLINFYNPIDFGLVGGTIFGKQANWENNQEKEKPFHPQGGGKYEYKGATGQSVFRSGKNKRVITDQHESMSMVARSRTKAVGAEGRAMGSLGTPVDLQGAFGFTDSRIDHSAQFYRDIQDGMEGFYLRLIEEMELEASE